MFEPNSRYHPLKPYFVTDNRGRRVAVVPVPDAPDAPSMGMHLRQQTQRLDHLAYKYLNDGTAYWRIAELNGAMLPEALSEGAEIHIPTNNP